MVREWEGVVVGRGEGEGDGDGVEWMKGTGERGRRRL